MLEITNLCSGYAGKEVLHDISLTAQSGQVTVIIGPNGCGKSTLLKTICGIQPVSKGQILLDGQGLLTLPRNLLAQKTAYLAQNRQIPDITVERLILHGRFPYLGYPRRYRQEDREAVKKALERVGADALAQKLLPQLSGGERQRIYLAMALAQNTETVLMDEPTTYLDVQHQMEVGALARGLAGEGKAVVLVLHDLSMALRFADEIAVLSDGRLLGSGSPEEIYDSGILKEVFGVNVCRAPSETGWRYYYG